MRFRVYKIVDDEKYKRIQIDNVDELFESLVSSPKLEDIAEQDEYAIMYLKKYEDYILGTFVQSYQKVLTKFDESGTLKKEIQLSDSKINDKTIFFIDCAASILYIQSKRYPEYLTMGIMIERFQNSLGKCMNQKIKFLPTEINNTLEQVEDVFKSSYVSRVSFRNLYGLELPKGSVLHNPREDLDEAVVESYNVYSKDTVDSLDIKAKKGTSIGKNPFAKIGMLLAKEYETVEVFKDMDIIDGGEKVNVKLKGNDSKIINISKKQQESPYLMYKTILKHQIKGYDGDND